ncbi:transposase [Actinomadura madurae]|uniref:transposase n=1 Tax=Actinomadura madurae TaxID=1993 RepID=UPI00210ADE0C|nr:transposase [Actinomadura madurae]
MLSGVRIQRVNAVMERWVQTCRRELLDRMLIWNQRHLLHALGEFETHYNTHRPHQGIANARPLRTLPPPIIEPDQIAHLNIRVGRRRHGGRLAHGLHLLRHGPVRSPAGSSPTESHALKVGPP